MARARPLLPLSPHDVQIYRAAEEITQAIIYSMVVFSPWAFGTTQRWSIWAMNIAGYTLGLLLLTKLFIRWFKGYQPPRWEAKHHGTTGPQDHGTTGPQEGRTRSPITHHVSRISRYLALLTIAILAYCLLSALNAQSTYQRHAGIFVYHDRYLTWLPHSLDSNRTWFWFWNYLALACWFWAVRDWLLGKSSGEERAEHQKSEPNHRAFGPLLPTRLRRLLWLLAINGGLLGIEGIVQRIEGSGKLLFLVQPVINPEAKTQFGPYHYRANASQYFNLLWPVCLGFWWMLRRCGGRGRKTNHLVLLCAAIMAACPLISTSRGGALITGGILVLATVSLMLSEFLFKSKGLEDHRGRRTTLLLVGLFVLGALFLGLALGWKTLQPRMAQIGEGFQDRELMYERARPMAADYPVFGTGPGTFENVFQLYRFSTETYWPAQLHNDWLETRITFGWVGSILIGVALLVVLMHWFTRGGIHGGRRFVLLIWLAVAGCLVHARYDFPFQIYSIIHLFLLLCSILFVVSRRAT